MPGGSAYQSGKLALIRFTEFINAEYGEQGLLSIAVHPGGVMTELSSGMPTAAHHVLKIVQKDLLKVRLDVGTD